MNRGSKARIVGNACLVTAAALTLASGSALAQHDAPLRAVEVSDAAGFGQPVVAAVVQIPADWQPRGGVQWDRRSNCVTNQARLDWVAESPDGSHAFELMHGLTWQVQGTQVQMNPCPVLPLDSARAFLQAVAQQRRPGARVLDYRERPDVAAASARSGRADPRVRTRHDAGDLLLGWHARGVELREVLSALVLFTEAQGNVVAGNSMVYALRAPRGQLDFASGERIAASIRLNPHWLAMMSESAGSAERRFSSKQRSDIAAWHAAEMARINAKGAADRAAIRAEGNRAVAEINNNTYESTQRSNDEMHRRNLEGIGEYGTYRNPNGGAPVRSSIHGGERVLQLPNGSTFSTSDPYLNPPGSTELQRVR